MKRGFPRPVVHLKQIDTWSVRQDAQALPNWEGKHYPFPYSARTDKINNLHFGRLKECISFRKCIVCGEVVKPDDDGKVTILLDKTSWTGDDEGIIPDSGPFHDKCARITEAKCPVINMQKKRFEFVKEDYVKVAPKQMKQFKVHYGKSVDNPEPNVVR